MSECGTCDTVSDRLGYLALLHEMKAEHEHVVAVARPGHLALHYLVAHHHATTSAAEQRIRDPRDGIAHGAQHVEELLAVVEVGLKMGMQMEMGRAWLDGEGGG